MKKVAFYISVLTVACIVFSASYYFSYKHALSDFNERIIQKNSKLDEQLNDDINREIFSENSAEETIQADSTNEMNKEDSSLEISKNTGDKVYPYTKYRLETIDIKNKTTLIEELAPPGEFIGLKREDIIQHLSDYMEEMPVKDYTEGLISYELVSFSSDEFTIRKTYNEETVPYKFYLAIRDGYVIIYYSDLKTVYDHTQIEAVKLPEKERNILVSGYYVKDLDELYSILEAYTS